MKAKRYIIKVCESAIDFVHGGGFDIEEVYIQEIDLFINEQMAFVLTGKDAKSRLSEAKNVKDVILCGDKELKELAHILSTRQGLEDKLRKEIFGTKNEDDG